MDFVTKPHASRWRFGVLLLLAATTSSCSSGPDPVDADLQQCSAQWNKILPLLRQVLNAAKNPRPPQADRYITVNASDKFAVELAKVKPQTPEVQKLQAELVAIDKASGDALVEWSSRLYAYEQLDQAAFFARNDYFARQTFSAQAVQEAAQKASIARQAVLACESRLQQWEQKHRDLDAQN